jgi:uncharacterized protein YidB (DUF937 family)
MSKMPNLTALLGLVAVAGYANRDKIASFVQGLTGGGAAAAAPTTPAAGGLSTTAITGGLTELITHLTQNGQGTAATSWVGTGSNLPITATQLQQALGPDIMNAIAAKTGIPADQLLNQLSAILPQVVDHMTPAGKLPSR